jgi:hypothetical protein
MRSDAFPAGSRMRPRSIVLPCWSDVAGSVVVDRHREGRALRCPVLRPGQSTQLMSPAVVVSVVDADEPPSSPHAANASAATTMRASRRTG